MKIYARSSDGGTSAALFFLTLLFFSVQFLFSEPTPIKRTDYLYPPKEVQYLNAGLKVQMADSFWLRAVQDIDFCDRPVSQSECEGKSWLFHVIDLATDLDKKFLEAYFYGALSLTIIVQDYAGASVIFDKGVEQFPSSRFLLYAAGYHAMFEEKNTLKAARLYLAAANNGAPEWVRLMAGRLASEAGDQSTAEQVLQQLIEAEKDPLWIEKLKKKIEQSKGR
jgi:hypothetical protein